MRILRVQHSTRLHGSENRVPRYLDVVGGAVSDPAATFVRLPIAMLVADRDIHFYRRMTSIDVVSKSHPSYCEPNIKKNDSLPPAPSPPLYLDSFLLFARPAPWHVLPNVSDMPFCVPVNT